MKVFSKTPFHKAAFDKARAEEATLLPYLQSHFNDPDLKQTEETFNKFDFVSPRRKIELKSRQCLVDTFKDLMIGSNKVFEAKKYYRERDYIFCFRFKDGTAYYWRYDPNVELECRYGGRTDRGYDERQDYHFIPNALLLNLPII